MLALAAGAHFSARADGPVLPRDLREALLSSTWRWTQSGAREVLPTTRQVRFTLGGEVKTSLGETWSWTQAAPRAVQIHFAPGAAGSSIVLFFNETFDRWDYVSPRATITGQRFAGGLPTAVPPVLASASAPVAAPVVTPVGWTVPNPAGQIPTVTTVSPTILPALRRIESPGAPAPAPNLARKGGSYHNPLDRGAYNHHRIWSYRPGPYYYQPVVSYYTPYIYNYPAIDAAARVAGVHHPVRTIFHYGRRR
jgi:hypothetical protein